MPVRHIRMDNRLIHGQILVSWNAAIKIDHIIVTNDKVAADPIQVTLLKAVAPIGAKVSVLSLDDTVAYCKGPEAENETIFIIAKFPEDGVELLKRGQPGQPGVYPRIEEALEHRLPHRAGRQGPQRSA